MNSNQCIITIITVCYNAEKTITSTIESVLSQSSRKFDYFIVDGMSADKTMDIVKSYENRFSDKGIGYRYISERDSGIYNAMNKAAGLASGHYVLYLNADDRLCCGNVIEKVIAEMEEFPGIDIYYGDMISSSRGLFRYSKAGSIDSFHRTMPFCHQCVFTLREILCQMPYDESFKLFADHDFYLRCYLNRKTFRQMSFPISVYSSNGFSAKSGYAKQKFEHHTIHYKNGLISRDEYEKNIKHLKIKAIPHDLIKLTRAHIPMFLVRTILKPLIARKGYTFDEKSIIGF